MRVTAAVKEQTRERILQQARRLFCTKGYQKTTTRDLAASAGIASGTLFNYFASKEILATALIGEALGSARRELEHRLRGDESLEEVLFAHVASGLRHLKPYRAFIDEILDGALSPFARSNLGDAGDDLRTSHLQIVASALAAASGGVAPSPITLHLYWTLYLGVLAYWATDRSWRQEETLALLDESMGLFITSLREDSDAEREDSGADAA